MILRVIAVVLVVGALAGGGFLLLSGGEEPPSYKVVLDNSFGLTEDADVRAAGVTVGKVETLDIQRSTARAVVTLSISKPEFGSFRRDVFCKVQPQSLIGEYFLNCDPGTDRAVLPEGGTIPVEQTAGTVPFDLVQNILRRPYRERLTLILSELGATFAGRGDDVNATIRRAVPALRETEEVLEILAANRDEITSLQRNGAVVLSRLADERDGVARFVSEARDTAQASAERRTELAGTIRRFPRFLRELRPTLRDLGTAARAQTPALRDLRASAGQLDTLFERLGPFSQSSRPFVRSTGDAARTGREAMRAAQPTVDRLRTLAGQSGEPLTNLRFVLEHLDDRDNAVEKNPLSPTGAGFTGLEALLQYPFTQSQAINIFDETGYLLKIALLSNECNKYTNAQTARENPGRTERCNGYLGPNQPGINQPDPSPGGARAASSSSRRAKASRRERPSAATAAASAPTPASGPTSGSGPTSDLGLADYLLGP